MEYIDITPPRQLRATVDLPASKSISNRALIITALCGESGRMPHNISDCDDTRVMLRALCERPEVVDVWAAGTAMRFLTAYLSATDGTHVITGTERMRHRPIAVLVDALRRLDARIEYAGEEGFPPLRIAGGRLAGGELALPGNVSSQYISALLMLGPVLEGGLRLRLTGGVVSRPYIDMTLGIMREFGADASWVGADCVEVAPRPYSAVDYHIENDWSAASYWYEMVALSGDEGAEVSLPGLRERSAQGDSRVAEFFRPLGVETAFYDEGICLRKCTRAVSHIELNLVEQPDLAQTLVATCTAVGVTFRFTGLQSLRIKETDRIGAMRAELRKLGFVVGEQGGDTLFWDGETTEPDALPAIDTYDDHRMAMSLAPLCLRLGRMRINAPQVVSKSYPRYWDTLAAASFRICPGGR